MFDPKKPIFQRGVKPASPSQSNPNASVATAPEEILALKKQEYEDDWIYNHKGKQVRVKFIDGEVLEGSIVKVRKFSFVLNTEAENVMVFKVAVKYVAEITEVLQ